MHSPALSTMWMQFNHDNLGEFIHAAAALGFAEVELSHVVTPEQIEALPDTVFDAVRVLHHPCPNPGRVPPLSALDASEHADAVRQVKTTILWAARLGTRAVVLHLGEVALDRRWEHAIRARWLQDERPTQGPYDAHRALLLAHRTEMADAHLDAVRRALDELLPFADHAGVTLAMENSEWFSALPTLDEARALLNDYPWLGLWVDTGHATIIERLGGPTLADWLALAPERLTGLHYHDVAGLRDHLIPGNGTLAWEEISPLAPGHALPTCEFDWYYHPDEIVRGATTLARHGLITYDPR